MNRTPLLSFTLLGLSGLLGMLGLLALSQLDVLAQTSYPMISSVYPIGVSRGKTTEVTVTMGGAGASLYRAYKVLIQGEGVRGEIVPPEKGWPSPDPAKPNELPSVAEAKVKITVDANAAEGVRELRIVTPRQGVSTAARIYVSPGNELLEAEPNNDAAKAQKVALPCCINGRIQEAEDRDYYRFHADAGQQVVFTALSARLLELIHEMSERPSLRLTLRLPDGKPLAESRDTFGADPLLVYRFEKAGDYLLDVRDVRYHGDPNWTYRLEMTTRPWITRVEPVTFAAGKRQQVKLEGYNLGGTSTVTVEAPAGTPPGPWTTAITLPGGKTDPVTFLISDLNETVRRPTAMTASLKAIGGPPVSQPIGIPGGASSWFASPNESHRYRFHVAKGEAWTFEVNAQRLGSRLDSEIRLRDAKNAVLDTNDDAVGKDSRLEWTAPEEGYYSVEVKGVDGASGPECFYHLTIRRQKPDFSLRCDPDRALVAPGNRTAWYVLVDRRQGFAGPVRIEAKGLPAGVTAEPVVVPSEATAGVLILTAAAAAPQDCAFAQIVGTGSLSGADAKPHEVSRIATPLGELYDPNGARRMHEVATQAVAVTEPNDVEVAVSTQAVSIAPGGSAKIEVEVKRRTDFTKAVNLDVVLQSLGTVFASPLPTGVTVDESASKLLVAEGETKGWIVLKAAPDAPSVAGLPLPVIANISINFAMRTWFASPAIRLSVNKSSP